MAARRLGVSGAATPELSRLTGPDARMPSVPPISAETCRGQSVVFYPSIGVLDDGGGSWRLTIRGSVRDAAPSDYRRKLIVRLLSRLLKATDHQLEGDIFQRRIAEFLAPGQRGKRVSVRLGERVYVLKKKSRRSGNFTGILRITCEEAAVLRDGGMLSDGWLHFQQAAAADEGLTTVGRVQLLEQAGISVISDIDDTIKHSDVGRRRVMLQNTFLKEFEPVAGMPEVYGNWARQGVAFHYVSLSPWQLYKPIEELCQNFGFPLGSYHLRTIRFRDPSVLRLFLAKRRGKSRVVQSIVNKFPDRRFVLIGDSGEKDPEIYGATARKYPDRVSRILIRQLDHRPMHAERLEKAFRGLPASSWSVFQDAQQISELTSLENLSPISSLPLSG